MSQQFIDTFQIVCLAFFLVVFIGRTICLRVVQKIRVFSLGVGKSGIQQAVELSIFFLLCCWVAEIFCITIPGDFRLFHGILSTVLFDLLAFKIIGCVLIALGQLVFLAALISFGDAWRIGVDKKTPGKLVTRGVFAVSRNPIFLFLNLYCIGIFFIQGTLVFLIFAILIFGSVHYQILQEEKFLAMSYGEPYQQYKAITRRYFGRMPGK